MHSDNHLHQRIGAIIQIAIAFAKTAVPYNGNIHIHNLTVFTKMPGWLRKEYFNMLWSISRPPDADVLGALSSYF